MVRLASETDSLVDSTIVTMPRFGAKLGGDNEGEIEIQSRTGRIAGGT